MENRIQIAVMEHSPLTHDLSLLPPLFPADQETNAAHSESNLKHWYWNRLEQARLDGACSISLPLPAKVSLSHCESQYAIPILKTISHWCLVNPNCRLTILLAASAPDTAACYRSTLEAYAPSWNHSPAPTENTQLLEQAIFFAMEKHKGAVRKGTRRPYILHPLATLQILASMDADFNLMAAGVLHDTLEDTDTTLLELYEQFGTDIAALVNAHTEDKRGSWHERKLQNINNLTHASHREKMLVIADKVANMRDMEADYQKSGEELWLRFNAPKQQQAWYYTQLTKGLENLQHFPATKKIYQEMTDLLHKLFS